MSGAESLPGWVAEAARLPVGFAQVREDPLLDLAVLERIGTHPLDCIMVASGGCTAAAMIASGRLAHVHLVDANPAQIALSRLKLHLLQHAQPPERLRLLGHAPMAGRRTALEALLESLGLARDALGPLETVAALGPDCAGRYELLFGQLREEMQDFSDELTEALTLKIAAARVARVDPQTPLGRAMDDAFDRTMALPNLIALFSAAAATQNSVQPFARHFASRTRLAIAEPQAKNNPYLWQLLFGHFLGATVYPWLNAPPPARMPTIASSITTFDAELAKHRSRFDLVHLSNILDWLSPDEARCTLDLAHQALRPGGMVFIRQLNSTLAIPSLNRSFSWLAAQADELHARDRSFFYAHLHLGQKEMNVHAFRDPPSEALAAALSEFESGFTYPLGTDRSFRISHGEDYARFFRSMGDSRCFAAQRTDRVIGAISIAIRTVIAPDGSNVPSAYIGDLKVEPGARGSMVYLSLARAAVQWARPLVRAAYGVVMDGTPISPTGYTGRMLIPRFSALGKIAVLRFPSDANRKPGCEIVSPEHGEAGYVELNRGKYLATGGDPSQRSEMKPLWLMCGDGLAFGRLEDTRRAKRLIDSTGVEMQSAHLACFAWRTPAAGAQLLHSARCHAARLGLPALFVSIPHRELAMIDSTLGPIDKVTAPATIYGAGLPADADWNVNSSEI